MEYTIDKKTYKLHYSLKRLEVLEGVTGVSPLSIVAGMNEQKFPSISVMKNYFAYALMDEGGVYAPTKKAIAFAEEYIVQEGFMAVMTAAVEQLMEDCPFLFQGGSSNSNT